MSKKLYIVGKTVDNKLVVGGVFYLYDSLGLPLCNILDMLNGKGWVPAWDIFLQDALDSGWKLDTILRRVKEGLVDIYDKQKTTRIMDNIEIIGEKKLKIQTEK